MTRRGAACCVGRLAEREGFDVGENAMGDKGLGAVPQGVPTGMPTADGVGAGPG